MACPDEGPRLDVKAVTARDWLCFSSPPDRVQCQTVSGTKQIWQERASFIIEDLDFLLCLDYDAFWSQLVHDADVHDFLKSLLQGIPRGADINAGYDEDVQNDLGTLTRKLFLVHLRMGTYKESKMHSMASERFGELIYNHFLFDIPRIIDICVLCRSCNPALTERLVENVFSTQPKYNNDLDQAVVTIINTMITAAERTEVLTALPSCDTPQQVQALTDLVAFVTDIFMSVNCFLQVYPRGGRSFHEQGFEHNLSAAYQNVLLALTKYAAKQREGNLITEELYKSLSFRLRFSRKSCVVVLRQIIESCCLTSVLSAEADSGETAEQGERFLTILGSCLSEGSFLVDYNNRYPIQDDLDMYLQAQAELDSMRVQYILNGIRSQANDIGAKMAERKKKQPSVSGAIKSALTSGAKKSSEDRIFEKSGPSDLEIESYITQVKDLLPDLGAGFVASCLDYYDNNPEKVINAIFEDNLPPHLEQLDRSMPREARQEAAIPDKPQPEAQPQQQAPQQRRYNVYDGDEFDVNERNEIDLSKVWRGKRSKGHRDASAMLDDKTEIRGMRDKFQGLDIVEDIVICDSGLPVEAKWSIEYDDEYDDTYDENAIGQEEPDAKDDLTERRPFVLPRALGGGHIGPSSRQAERDNDGSDEEEEDEAKKNRDFVRNPADIRAEKERRRQEKQGRSAPGKSAPPNRDVVGKAKGQGQEKQVLINRAKKNAQKNKHHRAGADRKNAKGMF